MIVTVTPNPSIDRTVSVDRLERGGLHRASSVHMEAAGKGLNVSGALRRHGIETVALFPLAAATANLYLGLLDGAVPTLTVPVPGSVRVNLTLLEPDGTVTKVNEPGPALSAADATALLDAAAEVPADWLVGCGSLPPGVGVDFYARLARLRSDRRRVAIDSSGPALGLAVQARPDVLKPNLLELEGLAGRSLHTLGDVEAAAGDIVGAGVPTLLVSLGADGALHVDAGGAAHAEAHVDRVGNAVGAGDALLAGYVAAGGGRGALPTAVAWSVAAVRSRGTLMDAVNAEDAASVTVSDEVDRSRVLRR